MRLNWQLIDSEEPSLDLSGGSLEWRWMMWEHGVRNGIVDIPYPPPIWLRSNHCLELLLSARFGRCSERHRHPVHCIRPDATCAPRFESIAKNENACPALLPVTSPTNPLGAGLKLSKVLYPPANGELSTLSLPILNGNTLLSSSDNAMRPRSCCLDPTLRQAFLWLKLGRRINHNVWFQAARSHQT